MSQQGKFERIIASLHEAMLDDSQWRTTSALIDDACGITGTHLVLVGGTTHGDAKWLFDKAYWHGEHREHLGRDYAKDNCPRDERIPRLLQLADQQIAHVTDIYTRSELQTSPVNELLRRAEARDGLNIRMDGPDDIHIIWTLANPTAAGGWNSEQITMIKRLLPHIRQFVRVRQALAGAHALGASLAGLLDNMLMGVLCLDWRGMIVQANARARDILRRRDGLVDRGGFFCARTAKDDCRLQRLLANALPRAGCQGTGGSITVRGASARPRIALHLTPVDPGEAGFGFGHVAVVVLVVDPLTKPNVDPAQIATTLGLSPAEGRLAAALAAGATMREVATATHRAPSTVHELLKRIHTKLGISRRADLVRIVISLAGCQWQAADPEVQSNASGTSPSTDAGVSSR